MKIEMGESLFYSWLRHVKECQIVQTNWKVSSQWTLMHENELAELMQESDKYFFEKYGYRIFKKNASLSQLIQQGECDAVGISINEGNNYIYAVDVAFHENGLNYGSKDETVMKVVCKCIRTAMCLYGFFDSRDAEIVFASPKINPAVLNDLTPCIDAVNHIFAQQGFDFTARIIANDDFNEHVLKPILLASDSIADTSELFMRSYQMYHMFATPQKLTTSERTGAPNTRISKQESTVYNSGAYSELKIGKLAQTVLRGLLEDGAADENEIKYMQTLDYSKQFFDLQFPLLVKEGNTFDTVRYYVKPLVIRGERYYMCSQWFEVAANNDRPYLENWIEKHRE